MDYISAAQAVVGDDLIDDVWLAVDGQRIAAIGNGRPPQPPDRSFADSVLVPGFVDIHCHGGHGGEFPSGDPAQAKAGAAAHLRHGTTTLVASLVTASPSGLLDQVAALSPLVDDGTFVGLHLEGPWLSAEQCGAHDPAQLRSPQAEEIAALLGLADGRIVMATLAPELPGSLAAIEQLVRSGVTVAVGHTDCDYATAVAAIEAGATVATHLFNRMPPLGKREPGPVLALLEDPRVTVELIADGVHIDEALLRFVQRSVGVDRIAAVTDAMGGADAPDGEYLLGSLEVTVRDGIARVAATGALAGSTLTMDKALQVWVEHCGVPLAQAARMCATTPAAALGLADRGRLEVGRRADLVALDAGLQVTDVLCAGKWVDAAR